LSNRKRLQSISRTFNPRLFLVLVVLSAGTLLAQDSTKGKTLTEVSFSKDVAPVLDKFCTTCHSSDEDHPSELFMDTYETLMKGGKHGKAIVPGDSKESLIAKKLSDAPPFGKMMPPPRKPRPTPEQIALILAWIDQGAKKN
jgi:hypothetical protein